MWQRGGLRMDRWHSFVNSLYQMRAAIFVLRRKGDSYAQAEKPEIQEPGRPEGLPRTAAITRECGHKKAPAIVILGAGAPVSYAGSQARSLNWQRRV